MNSMNWKVAIKYTATLFVVQFILGFTEGLLFEPSMFFENSFRVASFFVCALIFFHLSFHHLNKPYAHALAVLVMDFAVGLALGLLLYPWLGALELKSVLLGNLVLIMAFIAGTSLGSNLRQKSKMSEIA